MLGALLRLLTRIFLGGASPVAREDLNAPPTKSLLELAWAEWDVVQKKIDTVSNFPFTVKTWTVAVSGFLLGLGKGFDFPRWLSFTTVIIPILFWAIESKHKRVRRILERRAEDLELIIARLAPLAKETAAGVSRSLLRSLSRLPGIALYTIEARNELKRARVVWNVPEGGTTLRWFGRNLRLLWQKYVVQYADEIFYFA